MQYQLGATLVEFVVVVPTLLFLLMNLIQYGLLYHTKSQLNYATFEAARAGTTANANPTAIRSAFTRAMTGYYGGGTSSSELAASYAKAAADGASVRIEILSPSKESFDDFNSPALATKLGASRVIPNSNLAFIKCPVDVPGCKADPNTNNSGQTLLDANVLKLRITYGIPERKQIPLAGKFMNWALGLLNSGDSDAFRKGLVVAGRIPVVTHTVMRMQSPAIENGNASSPGPGNNGTPTDPGPASPPGTELPRCPATDPMCASDTPPGGPGPGDEEEPPCF
ncbi:TadE family protein [Rhodoferax ferrireducens]|uniref:TadE family protein n=1 Tax=Rhodoferax ferrireducens TaxID=192843 RepID=UPI000E0DF57D|nr:TadE family protein [Rhodoferax ferrireducens]